MAKELTARELQSMGGFARASKLTDKQRTDSARKAALARWAKYDKKYAKADKLVAKITEGTKELLATTEARAKKAKQKR